MLFLAMQEFLNILLLNVINSIKRLKEVNVIKSVDREKGSYKILYVFIIRKKSYISEKLFFQSCLPQIISILRILAQSSK